MAGEVLFANGKDHPSELRCFVGVFQDVFLIRSLCGDTAPGFDGDARRFADAGLVVDNKDTHGLGVCFARGAGQS